MRCCLPPYPSDPDENTKLAYLFKEAGRPETPGPLPPDDLVSEERDRVPGPSGITPFNRPVLAAANGPFFDARRFAAALRTRLSGAAVGWAFAITVNGQLAESDDDGDARRGSDGNVPMTINKRLNIASVSKTITAVGVLRLLEANGLTIDDPITPYLPSGWTLGPQVSGLTFRHLLTHRSGLQSTNTNFSQTLSYEGMANTIAMGAVPGADRNYLNVNFALFRVIIPALWSTAGNPGAHNTNSAGAAFSYASYFIVEVFPLMSGAIGENASTSPLDESPTLYYTVGSNAAGVNYGDWAMIAGGGGWHLSTLELAGFLANITYNDAVLSPAARAQMDSLGLGWARLSDTLGQFGQYFGHDGSIGSGTGRVRTAIMKYAIQVEAAVVANSNILDSPNPLDLLRDSFDAAWSL